jgi:hypothetical protein
VLGTAPVWAVTRASCPHPRRNAQSCASEQQRTKGYCSYVVEPKYFLPSYGADAPQTSSRANRVDPVSDLRTKKQSTAAAKEESTTCSRNNKSSLFAQPHPQRTGDSLHSFRHDHCSAAISCTIFMYHQKSSKAFRRTSTSLGKLSVFFLPFVVLLNVIHTAVQLGQILRIVCTNA